MKKGFFLGTLSLLFCCFQSAKAQKLSIENVHKVYLRSSGVIKEKEEVSGYFFLYQSDKIDRNTNAYTLQVLDQNLNKVRDYKFQDSKKIVLLESAYNGTDLVFLFYNEDQSLLEAKIYGTDSKLKFSYTKELDKKSKRYIEQFYDLNVTGDESTNRAIYGVDNGFLAVYPIKEGSHFTYEVNYFGSDKKRNWTYNAIDQEKRAVATFMGSTDKLAVLEVLKYEGASSKDAKSALVGVNIETGKKEFEVPTENAQYKFHPMNMTTVEQGAKFIMIGPYYDADARIQADRSKGLALFVFDGSGKVVEKKLNTWDGDIAKRMGTDSRGRVDGLGYIFFHKFLQTADGNYFAIGEGYRQAASALGIATAVGGAMLGHSPTTSTVKMKVTDMVLMQFNSKFDITKGEIIAKQENNVEMPFGAEFSSPHIKALLLKAWDHFDYAYTLTDNDHTGFMMGYRDYVKSKDYKGLTFHAISYFNNKLSKDKINLSSTASTMKILPAGTDKVVMVEYFKKDKRMDMRLEKLN